MLPAISVIVTVFIARPDECSLGLAARLGRERCRDFWKSD